MSSNSEKMTLEEKVVQQIKDTKVAELIVDEEALTELVCRAVKAAVFEPQTVMGKDNWGSPQPTKIEPLVIQEARNVVREQINKLADETIRGILEKPEVVAAVQEAITENMAAVLLKEMQNAAYSAMQNYAAYSFSKFKEQINKAY